MDVVIVYDERYVHNGRIGEGSDYVERTKVVDICATQAIADRVIVELKKHKENREAVYYTETMRVVSE